MARASLARSLRRNIARWLAPEMTRTFDAASWKRFPAEARSGRMTQETLMAAPAIRSKALYFYGSDAHARAGVDALVVYSWGAGAMPTHARADAFADWGLTCDADGVLTFDGLFGAAIREMIVTGEVLILFIQRDDGLKLRLIPAAQLDASLSRDRGGGNRIDAGIETDAQGRRVAFWILPSLPTTQFESYAPPVRFDAADVVHLYRPVFVGQTRGISWLAPVLLKLADLGLLSDALLKNFQVSALNSVYLIDRDGTPGVPFEGDKNGDALENVSLEPGAARILRGNWDMHANTPQQAQQSIEFLTASIEEISAGLGVPAFMVSGNVNRANYSSLRAALITFKASVESWQFATLVPALHAIWRRWALTESLRGAGDDDAALPTWRFVQMPEADPVKQVTATKLALEAKLTSRAQAIAERGEDIARVDAAIAADPFAQQQDQKESVDEGK